MKCYVLMVSESFPTKHSKKGQPTRFWVKIWKDEKKHTIRLNYELWKKRIEKINAGKAYLSVRKWEGTPYRSTQKEQFRLYHVGLQKVKANKRGWFIDGNKTKLKTEALAINDGLELADFKEWFKELPKEPMAIIHFTDLRY